MSSLATEGQRPSTAVVLGVCALILAPTLTYRIGVDQGAFAYMSAAWLRGAWPYVHTWENDFPGLVFLQAAEILAFGKSVAMFRLFDLLFQLGNAYLVFRITSRLSSRPAGLLAAGLFCATYQRYGPWNTAQREGFALLFVLAGFWWYLTAERRAAALTAVAIGLGLGMAVTIKPTILALALFYAPLLTTLRHRRARSLAAVATLGLILPAMVLIVGYWIEGGLTQMYEACVAYQGVYTARLRGHEPLMAIWWHKLGQFGVNSVVLPVVSVPILFTGPIRRERLMVWLGYVGSLYAVFVQGTFAGYHYLPGLGLGAVLVGCLVSAAGRVVLGGLAVPLGARRVSAQTLLPIVLLAIAALYNLRHAPIRQLVTLEFLDPPVANEFRNGTVFDFTESYQVSEYLRERTRPDEPIQIWGYESLVYYLADRQAASRFQMTHPLVMRVPGQDVTPMQQRWRAEFVNDMKRRAPAYVAVVRDDNWWWAPEERTSEQLLDDFPEWKSVIEREYHLEHTIGRFLIYRRSSGSTP